MDRDAPNNLLCAFTCIEFIYIFTLNIFFNNSKIFITSSHSIFHNLLVFYYSSSNSYFAGHAGPRITVPRSLRWAACGAVTVSSSTALLVRLFSPECEPQNIAAYDNKK